MQSHELGRMIFLRRAGSQSRMVFGRVIIPLQLLFVRDLFRKPVPTFRDHAFCSCVIFSENRYPLFGITH